MRYRVLHRTEYRYAEPVLVSLNQVCLTPRDTALQRVIEHHIDYDPAPHARMDWRDCFGNQQHQSCFSEPHAALRVEADSLVEVEPPERPQLNRAAPWELSVRAVREHAGAAALDALQFVYTSPFIRVAPMFRALAEPDFPPGASLPAALAAFAARFQREFTYDASATVLHTPIEDVLRARRGVCQDFTQLMIAALRSLGLAARYVSGYLRTLPPPGKPRLIGADASHCWVSVFATDWGWIDVDPTNGCLVADQHITIAWGRDYGDVTPVKGVILGGGAQQISVSVDVTPADEGAAGNSSMAQTQGPME